MRRRVLLIAAALVAAVSLVAVGWLLRPADAGRAVEVRFSPKGGCTDAVVREIAAARRSVLVQAYSLSSPAIASALVDARARGVDVRVLLDKSARGDKASLLEPLERAGVVTAVDDKHALANSKVMLIDEAVVLTGSFNNPKAAESDNVENLVIIRDRAVAARYFEHLREHYAHAVLYPPPSPPKASR
jgi:phosphatidylserine/phosphatidylglycerophosphate/cardiolipin synthase-like enzyme